jgi:signal peptidase I
MRKRLLVLVAVVLVVAAPLVAHAVSGGSKAPVKRTITSVARARRGQIALMRPLSRQLCPRPSKRVVVQVVGLPGEDVSVHGNVLLVNRRAVALAPYLGRPIAKPPKAASFPPQRVPAGQYLVLGDERNPACDSRYFGPVPLRFILKPVLPQLPHRSAFRQGYDTCANFGLDELAGLYGTTDAKAIAAGVAADEPSPQKDVIGKGCLAGLRNHPLGQATAPPPPHFVEND